MTGAVARKAAAAQAEAALEQLGCSDEQEIMDLAKAISLSAAEAAATAPCISIHGVPAIGAPSVNTITHFPDDDADDSDDDSGDGDSGHDDNGDDGTVHIGDEINDDSATLIPVLLASRPLIARQPVSTLAFSATQQWRSWSVRSRPWARPHSRAPP